MKYTQTPPTEGLVSFAGIQDEMEVEEMSGP